MLAELTKKQLELLEIMGTFQELRSFVLELRRATKNKRFHISSTLAWEGMLALQRMLVIDLAAWIDSLLPPRPPQPGEVGWLKKHLDATELAKMQVTPSRAAALAASSYGNAPKDIQAQLRDQRAGEYFRGHRDALRRVFGQAAVRRGHPVLADVQRLVDRLFRWAQNVRRWRNTHAHRFGTTTGSVRALRLRDLARRFESCAKLANDLRLLVDSSNYIMPQTEPTPDDALARDIVDLVVVGTIPFAVEQWKSEEGRRLGEKRDAYYQRLHRRRRKKRTDPFNLPR